MNDDMRRRLVARAAEAIHRLTCQADKPEHCDGAIRRDFDLAVAAMAGFGLTGGSLAITGERWRQVTDEGWTPERDAGHSRGELARAAIAYAWFALDHEDAARACWPFSRDGFKPVRTEAKDATRSLVKAGALIAAEIDRLRLLGEDDTLE